MLIQPVPIDFIDYIIVIIIDDWMAWEYFIQVSV